MKNDDDAEMTSQKSADSKVRPLRWGCIAAALVAIGLVASIAFMLFGPSELDEQLAALRSAGLPTNAEELAEFYAVPQNSKDTTDLWIAAIDGVVAANINQRAMKLPIVGQSEIPIPDPGKEWTELEASREFLNTLSMEFAAIMQAAEAGGMARFPVDFKAGFNTPPLHVQESRTLARLLSLHAHVQAHDGNHSQVLRDVQAIFATSDAISGEPVLISHLVRIALHAMGCQLTVQMLPHCNWSDSELEQLQTAVLRARFMQEMRHAVHGERAMFLITSRQSRGLPFMNLNVSKGIELFNLSTDGLNSSWTEAMKKHDEIDARLKMLAAGGFSRLQYFHVLMLSPPLRYIAVAGGRAEARQNCTIAVIAAKRHQLATGNLPESLEQLRTLIPGDSASVSMVLTDPFDNQPLRFKRQDKRLLIYSIGDNLTDDGGTLDRKGLPLEGDLGFSFARE
jgi:hypothetical protein